VGPLWIANPQYGCHDEEIRVLLSFCFKLVIFYKTVGNTYRF
jgi:hypothetical protein